MKKIRYYVVITKSKTSLTFVNKEFKTDKECTAYTEQIEREHPEYPDVICNATIQSDKE
jgi:hypothetical protein